MHAKLVRSMFTLFVKLRGAGGRWGWGVERETERANDKSTLYVIYQTDQGMGTCKRVFIRQSLNRTLKHTQTEGGREVGVA